MDNTSSAEVLDIATNSDVDIPSEYIQVSNNTFDKGRLQCQIGGARHVTLFGNIFINSTDDNGVCLKLEPYDAVTDYEVFENIINGNIFYNNRWCIQIAGSAATLESYRNIISNNLLLDGPDVSMTYGVYENATNVDNNVIINNIIQGAATAAIFKSGASTVVRDNIGYTTEAKGATASVADGGTITHGLVATPTVAIATGSVANEFVSATTLGATTITVAIKKHDGSAGTTQTVYWHAWVQEGERWLRV